MSAFIPAREKVEEFERLKNLSTTKKFRKEGSRIFLAGPPYRGEFCVVTDGRKKCPCCGKICNSKEDLVNHLKASSILIEDQEFGVVSETGGIFLYQRPLQNVNSLQMSIEEYNYAGIGFSNHHVAVHHAPLKTDKLSATETCA